MVPIDAVLVKSLREWMKTQNVGSQFFADAIVRRQIKDIPEPEQRVYFDEAIIALLGLMFRAGQLAEEPEDEE